MGRPHIFKSPYDVGIELYVYINIYMYVHMFWQNNKTIFSWILASELCSIPQTAGSNVGA